MKRSRILLRAASAAALARGGSEGRKLVLPMMAVSMLTVLAFPINAHAADPLVDVAWVKANIGKAGVVFVDLRGAKDYRKGHVPGAVHTSYGKAGLRVNKNPVKGLMPAPARLEKLIGRLGIDNNSHIVLLPAGKNAADMGRSTRLYWTFKVLGHDEVSILNGGVKAYLANKKNSTAAGVDRPKARIFKADPRKDLLATESDVRQALKNGTVLIDNRSADKHLGITTPRSKNKRAGTVPGAKSLPGVWLTRNGGGAFRDATTLKSIYAYAGATTGGKAISFCDTGHWASLGWFVNYEILGNKRATMYDGSMSEWSQTSSNPMVQKVKFD